MIDLGKGWSFPIAGGAGIATKEGLEHLRQSIMLIVMTPKGSRVMRPWFGSNLWKHLDSPINSKTLAAMRYEIYEALKEETRGSVTKISIQNPEPQWLYFTIEFLVENVVKIAVKIAYDRDMARWQEGIR